MYKYLLSFSHLCHHSKSMYFYFQEAISYSFNVPPDVRIVHRGGGSSSDWLASGSGTTCETFCNNRMRNAGLDPNPGGHPHYTKCYDAKGTMPANGHRFGFPSQVGTLNLDPALSQMTPYTNASLCMRKKLLIILSLY